MKSTVYIILVLLFPLSLEAQEAEKSKVSMNLEGQFALTSNGRAGFVNFGGPAIKFNFSKFAFALNFMPSLRVEEQKSEITVTPLLGAGLQFYFLKNKKFILSFPCYYYANRNVWVGTAGIGYVLTTPKK